MRQRIADNVIVGVHMIKPLLEIEERVLSATCTLSIPEQGIYDVNRSDVKRSD